MDGTALSTISINPDEVLKVDSLEVRLAISAREYQLHYMQPGTVVSARASDGRRVRFPARLLQRFVSHTGIYGRFRIAFDSRGRCHEILRVAD